MDQHEATEIEKMIVDGNEFETKIVGETEAEKQVVEKAEHVIRNQTQNQSA